MTIAVLTDGQADVVSIDGTLVTLQEIGGLRAAPLFRGTVVLTPTTITRGVGSEFGNFHREGFAVGQLIQLNGFGATYRITAIDVAGSSMTVAPVTAGTTFGAGTATDAVVSRIINQGLFTGNVTYDAATNAVIRHDGSTWLTDGFVEGQRIRISTGANAGDYKIALIDGPAGSYGTVMHLTLERTIAASAGGLVTVTQLAAVITFLPGDFYVPRNVVLAADPLFDVPFFREGVKPFPVLPHLLTRLRGPLAVEGGETGADRSLQPAVMMPGERNGPLYGIAPQPPENLQIDTLNVFDDSSQEDKVGQMTSTGLTGLGMAAPLTLAGGGMFGEPATAPGGISFGVIAVDPTTGAISTDSSTTTIEVLNVLLGKGDDRMTIISTMVPGVDRSTGVTANHGGLTTVHGGGGDDTLIVTGGPSTTAAGGPASPLVLYGDTSQDGRWYSGLPADPSAVDFGAKPFDQIGSADDRFYFPVAFPYVTPGNDVIDAHLAFSASPAGALPTVGITAYGGEGDDIIIGSQAGDHLAGGSGNDLILGQRGLDHIYGDSGINVDVITRTLAVPTVNTSVSAQADEMIAGEDELHGEGPGSVSGNTGPALVATGDGDDIIFGDHGVVTQAVPAGRTDLTGPAVFVRLQTTRLVLAVATAETQNGADDVITGDTGNDRIGGGNGDDLIAGDDGFDIVFGDHGRIDYATPDGYRSVIRTTDPMVPAGDDTIGGDNDDDVILGGDGDDLIAGEQGNDIVLGDHGRLDYDTTVGLVDVIRTTDPTALAGADVITGDSGDDVIMGGNDDDRIQGNDGRDVILGDHGLVDYDTAVVLIQFITTTDPLCRPATT